MEILTARIKQLNKEIQILALSATVSNAQEIATWLRAELVSSDWRPIPLKEGVYFNEAIQFEGHGIRQIKEEFYDDLSKLAVDTLRGKGQVLVFVSSRRSAQASSLQLSKAVSMSLTQQERKELVTISKEIVKSANTTKICHKLATVVAAGTAFHHAGLKPNQRKLIEDSFKKNLIKVICSTPTLAAGVNLPARRAIIRDIKRFEKGYGAAYIPTSEYKQCAGRAGRPQYDEFGEAVIMAKSLSESHALFDKYILADPEPVISKLANESALRIHILASIAGGYVHDIRGMFDFISHTFLSHQKRTGNLLEIISNIFEFLHVEGFIEKSGFRFFATPFGQCTSRLYIDPISSIIIKNGLSLIDQNKPFPIAGLIHLMCCCPDSPLLKNISKKDYEELDAFAANFRNEFILDHNNTELLDDMNYYLSTLKTTWLFLNWIEEEKEDSLCDQFNVGPGDIYRHIESAQWLFYAAGIIASLFNYKKLTFSIDNIGRRIKYGIKAELLDIASLKGVGRIRARNLFNKGFKKVSDIKFSSVDELTKVNQVGKSLAKDIMDQVLHPRKRKKVSVTS